MKQQTISHKNSDATPVSESVYANRFNENRDRLSNSEKEDEKNLGNAAIYFLTFVVIVIVTFTLFQSKILNFLFSHLI